MNEPPFSSLPEKTVVIVGVGLIGGSLAATIKKRQLAKTVIGVGRDASRIEAARLAGLIDEATTDLGAAVHRADLIVFCTPVDRLAKDVRLAEAEIAKRIRPAPAGSDVEGPLLTDVGSVKSSICDELSDVSRFIGSHPIAGSHRQGYEASDPNLFEGRTCVLTPLSHSPTTQIERLERFWQAVGMKTVRMTPAIHDQSLALTSHLPHVVASALAAILSAENRQLTGTGFRDTTRVAAGDPGLWTGILMGNADSVIRGIHGFQQSLERFRDAIARGDSQTLNSLLREGQASRKALDQSPQRIE